MRYAVDTRRSIEERRHAYAERIDLGIRPSMAGRAFEPRRAAATDAVEMIAADFGAPGAVMDADLRCSAAALTSGGVGEQPGQGPSGWRIVHGAGGDHGCCAPVSSSY